MAMSERQIRRKYEHALRRHEADIANAERAAEDKLRDPVEAAGLGLPPELPDFTVGILRKTMALDRRGADRPVLARFLEKFG